MRTTLFFLLMILCLALTASAQNIYSEGPIDGNDNAFFVTGPNLPNFLGSVQDISNGFVAANSGTVGTVEWGEWSVGSPTTANWSLSASAFGNELGSGAFAAGDATLLFTNGFGYGVYDVKATVSGGPTLTAGNTYWLTISNANDTSSDGTQAWDIPNGGSGGPATCNFRQSGTNFGDCGLGGESFTLSVGGTTTTTTCGTGLHCGQVPDPSTILLFGSGILGLVSVVRRKLNR